MIRSLVGLVFFSCAATAVLAATVTVGGQATGGFGNFNTGWQDLMAGPAFVAAGEQVSLSASGLVDGGAGGVTVTGPDGFPGPVDNNFLLTSNYAPLEEAAVDAGALALPRTLGSTVPNFQALFAVFVPVATANAPGFRARDEDLVGPGEIGVPAAGLFLLGKGPRLFIAPGPGRLYFGVNDTYAANNSGAYLVTVPDPLGPPSNAPVRISEFLADNQNSLRDEDGEVADWVELYNPAAVPVALAGWQLVNGSNAWTFPMMTLRAQKFLVVFASGKDRVALPGPLHTNFKLDAGGESLALRQPDGTVTSEFAPAFPEQRPDVSYGFSADGEVVFFLMPTPAAPNGAFVHGFVADTKFDVKRGFFTAPFTLNITSATPAATIRYTLDGRTPTETNGTQYIGPLVISNTTMLRARAFRTGWAPTDTDTRTYLFLADVLQQSTTRALAAGWPASPVNGQQLRYGLNPALAAQYTAAQILAALRQVPTLSLVTDQGHLTDPATGLYVHAEGDGDAWERPVSLELLPLDGTNDFQIDAGLRIRGGASRQGSFPKHSFHVNFRSAYGASKLKYPLFGNDGAQEFNTIDLRCEHGYAYADPLPYGTEFTAIRDVFCRDLWAAAGYASTRSQPYHLYLNGQYWGLYQSQERAQEDFGASYFGGTATNYDVVKATGIPQLTIEVSSGDLNAWQQLWNGARVVAANPANSNYFALLGRHADGSMKAAQPRLLDPEQLAAYLLLHYFTGHSDEPLSVSFNFEKPNNFRALRRRDVPGFPFQFFVHDGESSVRAPEWVDNRANAVNLTSPNRAQLAFSNPEWIHEDLLANTEYRVTFADVAQRLLFNDGPFTTARAQTVFDARAAQIAQAVIGESIRWGREPNHNQATWAAKISEIRTLFFPNRPATVIAQLRTRGLFPSVNAPTIMPRGGVVAAGARITLSNGGVPGTVFYTLDGTDPRAIGGGLRSNALTYAAPGVALNSAVTLRTRFRSNSGEWSALDAASFTTFPPANATNLVISKIHYHPADPTAVEFAAGYTNDGFFEYLELQNISTNTIALGDVRVTDGVTFSFADRSMVTLASSARVVVVKNTNAFTLHFGAGLPVAGQFAGSLNNGGELLRVGDAGGATITRFSFNDSPPWPSADGTGAALVLRTPNLDPGQAASWRASYVPGGKPGADDVLTLTDWRAPYFSAAELADLDLEATLWGALADPDGDGAGNLAEFALGGTPRNALERPAISGEMFTNTETGERFPRLYYRVREGISGVTVAVQSAEDLVTWTDSPTPVGVPINVGDGMTRFMAQDPLPLNAAHPRRFLRVKVTAP